MPVFASISSIKRVPEAKAAGEEEGGGEGLKRREEERNVKEEGGMQARARA